MTSAIPASLLFLTPALTFAFPGSYSVGGLAFAALGIRYLVKEPEIGREVLSSLRSLPVLWAFGFYVVIQTLLTAYHGDRASNYGNVAPFVIFPLILVAIWKLPPNAKGFWLGTAVGGLITLGIASYQIYVVGMERAIGFRNPIPFGNTSVVLGTAALFGLVFYRQTFQRFYEKALLAVGGLAGLLGCLLSGSKGGWLSLLMVLLIASNKATQGYHWAKRLAALMAIMGLLAAMLALSPRSVVADRIISAYQGVVVWLQTGEVTEGSASARLEAFKAGMIAGSSSPLVGHGQEGQFKAIQQAIDDGKVRKEFMDFKVIDNEFISLFASKGLLGVLAAVLVHAGIFFSFFRYRQHELESVRNLATMGMLLVVLYLEFGLSVSVLGTNIFRIIYVSWSMILLGLILAETRPQPAT